MNRGDSPQSEMTIRERMALDLARAMVGIANADASGPKLADYAVHFADALIAELAKADIPACGGCGHQPHPAGSCYANKGDSVMSCHCANGRR